MRVMVSLNLADIMTAIRPTTSHVYETPNNEADPTEPSQESQRPANSEPMKNTTELIE
jgi:hypothetical protein